MKRMILTLACLAAFVANAFALTYTYHNEECGKMSENCDVAGGFAYKVSHVIVSGNLNNDDFAFITSTFENADTLDVSAANVTWNGEYNKLKNNGETIYMGDGIGIEVLYFPDNVIEVGNLFFHQAFAGLKKIIVKDNPYFSSYGGVLYDKSGETLIAVPASFDGVLEIPETARVVVDYAGYGIKDLKEIHFSSRLSEIGRYAFACCNYLTTLKRGGEVPESEGLKVNGRIDEYAFNSCNLLSEVELPDCISAIGKAAFARCGNLRSVVLPRYLKDLSGFIFAYGVELGPKNTQWVIRPLIGKMTLPKYLETLEVAEVFRYFYPRIEVAEDCLNFTSIDDGVIYNKDKTYLYYYPKDRVGSYEIPETCKTIGYSAFCNSMIENLTSNSVEELDGLLSSWDNAENPYGNSDLVVSLSTFEGCSHINNVTLNSINEFGFSGIGLPMKSLIIPSASFVFLYGCKSLELLEASSAEEVDISSCLIKRAIFGNKLKTVGDSSFDGLDEVYVSAVEPPEGKDWSGIFEGTLFVPEGCYEKYFVAPFWSCFRTIEEYDFGGVPSTGANAEVRVVATDGGIRLEGADAETRVVVYDVSGRMMYDGMDTEIALPQGMYIVKTGSEVSKVIVR